VDYWKDLDLFKEITHRAIDQVDQKTERTRDLKPFRFIPYALALGFNYFLIPFIFWAALSFFVTLAIYSESWHTKLIAVLGSGVAIYLAMKVFHFVIEGRQAVIYKIQPSTRSRKIFAFLLPAVYTVLIAVTGYLTWTRGGAFYSVVRDLPTGAKFWEALAQRWEPFPFILSFLGLLVVSYGLAVYLYYKFQNRRPETIKSYKSYVEAGKAERAPGSSGSVTEISSESGSSVNTAELPAR
jgi:hypothetical protein